MFKIIAFFIITLYAQLFARICILLTCGKPLHDLIISLRREVRAHQTIVIPPLFIDVSVTSQKSERSFILVVRGFDFTVFYDFDVWFWNCSDKYGILELFWQVWYFGIVPTSVVFWNCSDKCDILELSRIVWYLLFFVLLQRFDNKTVHKENNKLEMERLVLIPQKKIMW